MQPAPRLILVDLDGTLLGADGQVSERNAAALRRATEAGAHVVIASGRPVRILTPLSHALSSSVALCYNGAIVLDLATDEVLEAHLLDGPLFRSIVEKVRENDELDFIVAVEGTPDIGIRGEHGFREGMELPRGTLAEITDQGIVKGLIRTTTEDFDAIWDAFSVFPESIEITRSGIDGLIEISAKGVSKGGVIAGLAAEWGIDAADAIAFGDMPNDLDMFRWAGRSVAMGNADPQVKLVATEIGADHDDDVVARVLERWF